MSLLFIASSVGSPNPCQKNCDNIPNTLQSTWDGFSPSKNFFVPSIPHTYTEIYINALKTAKRANGKYEYEERFVIWNS